MAEPALDDVGRDGFEGCDAKGVANSRQTMKWKHSIDTIAMMGARARQGWKPTDRNPKGVRFTTASCRMQMRK